MRRSLQNQNWKINFFKKNFYGNAGHYIINNQPNYPIQQSFVISHNKKINNQNLEFAVGRFLTKSGLPDINQNGKELNEILSSSFRIKSNLSNINTVLYFSQFFQNRRIFHSTFSDSSYQKINRSLLKFKIYKRKIFSLNSQIASANKDYNKLINNKKNIMTEINLLRDNNLDSDYITEISYDLLGLIQSDQIVIDIK